MHPSFSVVKHMSGRSGDQTGGERLSSVDGRIDADNNSFSDMTTPIKA